MTISKVKNYNVAPHYDDFDETKNYHRILFRPGYAVQARELTQLQTALQAQIDKHGQHAFPDGGRVLGGKATLDIELDYIQLQSDASNVTEYVGREITVDGDSSKPTARVIFASEGEGADLPTLFVKYITGTGVSGNVIFEAGDSVSTTDAPVITYAVEAVGKGSAVHLEEGVYFISGTFVHVPSETIILEKYSSTPSATIGLQITERIVDSSNDASLLDNAQGVPNSSAPGAMRYQIDTVLVKEPFDITDRASNNYITLLRINNGVKVGSSEEGKTIDTELSTRLARRTKEESGDYVVRPFVLDIRENVDPEKVDIGVEPSIAYVQGYRAETLDTTYLTVDKPRADSIGNAEEVRSQATLGNYIIVDNLSGAPTMPGYASHTIHNAATTEIGNCKVRGIRRIGSEVRAYIFDIVMEPGFNFTDARRVEGTAFDCDIVLSSGKALLYDTATGPLLYQLPFTTVKTVGSVDGSRFDYHAFISITQEVTAGSVTFSSNDGGVSNQLFQSGADAILLSSTGEVTTGSISFSTTDITYTGLSAYDSQNLTLVVRVVRNGASFRRTKTQSANSETITYASGTSKYQLDRADIIKINSIVDSDGTDITELFELDDGQRDNYYAYGSISSVSSNIVDGDMTVNYSFYSHSSGDYITVNSYSGDYEDIPSYSGISLRDVIDFRPIKRPSDGFSSSLVNTPWPSSLVECDIEYYLPRIDKLYITREGTLGIAKGAPASSPVAPQDVKDTLTLYNLAINPYVFDLGDIIPKIVSNTRYTMEDISKLDKRLKTLEYYTALSLLEQNANNIQITDELGATRLKNGILVDSFRGHTVGDISNKDYSVSIDKKSGSLRPKFDERSVDLVVNTASAGTAIRNKSIVTLPFTETVYVNQPYASVVVNVNPYDVFTWSGMVELSPDSDEWKDTDTRPDVIIDDEGNYDQLVQQAEEEGILGTVWGEWETNWAGQENDTIAIQRPSRLSGEPGFFMEDGSRVSNRFNGWGRGFTITTLQSQTRTGIKTDVVPDTVQKTVGTRVVEVNFIPFMRSRKIQFKAQLMKPNTKVYPFFNGIAVDDYVREGAFSEFAQNRDAKEYKEVTSHPDGATTLITDGTGKVEGSFIIPSNSSLKFKTGTRQFRLTDSPTNDRSTETTSGEAQFAATGLLETSETTIISTKVPRFVSTEATENRALTNTRRNIRTTWVDPVAQTFLITEENGLFMASTDLYFSSKDATVPVRVSIRSVENGIPTQKIVPGSDIVVYPTDVNISGDGSSATNVAFDYPIYLEQDQEYCIVLMAQSNKYNVYVAEMGGTDLLNQNFRINRQPYNGVFFTSQNASTWTPEQNKDLKFKLNRCKFTGTSATLNLVNNTLNYKRLKPNSVETTTGSSLIKIHHKNHGMHPVVNTRVTITEAETFNGISPNVSNVVISEIKHDSYKVDVGVAATASGFGGGSSIFASEWRHIDLLNFVCGNIQVPGTTIKSEMSLKETTTIDSGQTSENTITGIEILPNKNITFDRPYAIRSGSVKTCGVEMTLFTDRDTLSPVIDLNRTSLVTIQNIINNIDVDNEDGTSGGDSLARYITKRVDLVNISSNIDVIIDAFLPSTGIIDLYYKVASSDSEIVNTSWVKAEPTSIIPTNKVAEVKYEIEPGDFSSMIFKIVLKSSNSSAPPLVKDLRVIASL